MTAKSLISKKSNIDRFIFISLCFLLFYPPFFRGLFFQREFLITHIITFSLLAIWIIGKLKDPDFRLFNSWVDLLALGVVLMYFVSIFYGVNKRAAIAEFLKYSNYLVIYLMARYFTANDDSKKRLVINVLLASGVVVAIIGIGSAIGTFTYNGAYVGGRINSTFQYPNTLASYLIAVFILALGQLQLDCTDIKERLLYAIVANIYIFTFIPTFSRGMWLLAPLVILAYLIIIPNNKKLQGILYLLSTIIPALLLSTVFIRNIENNQSFILWIIFLASPTVTAILTYLLKDKFKQFENTSFKKLIYVLIVIAVICTILGTIALNSTEPLVLSNINSEEDKTNYVDRHISNIQNEKEYRLETNFEFKNPDSKPYAGRIYIYSIDGKGEESTIETANITEGNLLNILFTTKDDTERIRIRFYNRLANTEVVFKEAILYDNETDEVIKEINLKYKYIPETIVRRLGSITSSDNSAQARFAFYKDGAKVIKDYPIFGAGGGAWKTLYFKYQSYMYWSTEAHNYFLQLWIEIGAIGLLIFSSLIILLLIESISYLKNNKNHDSRIIQSSIIISILSILGHSLIDFDLSLGAMVILLWALFGLIEQNKTIHKLSIGENFMKPTKYVLCTIAILLIICSFSLRLSQSYANKAIAAAKENNITESAENFEVASKLDPFTASYRTDLSTMYHVLSKNDKSYLDKALLAIEKSTKLAPYDSKILTKAGQLYLQTGEIDKGLNYLEEALRVQPLNKENYKTVSNIYLTVAKFYIKKEDKANIDKITERIEKMKEILLTSNDKAMRPIGFDKELNDNLQKLNYVVDFKDNMDYLKDLDNLVLYNRFDIDLDKNGLPDGTRITNKEDGRLKILDNNTLSLTNDGTDYGILWIDNKLDKNQEYEMIVNYKSSVEPQNFNIYLYDFTGQMEIFHRIKRVEKNDLLTQIITSFTTPDNIESGKQKIGIIHRGNGGNIGLRSIIIFEK